MKLILLTKNREAHGFGLGGKTTTDECTNFSNKTTISRYGAEIHPSKSGYIRERGFLEQTNTVPLTLITERICADDPRGEANQNDRKMTEAKSNADSAEQDLTTNSGNGGVLIEDTEHDDEKHVTLYCVGCGNVTKSFRVRADNTDRVEGVDPIHKKDSCEAKADEIFGNE